MVTGRPMQTTPHTLFIRGIYNAHRALAQTGCVLTIGNFDGVHLGHQAVLAQVRAQALKLQVPAVAMTFEPQPQELFAPMQAPARLTNLREKHVALAAQQLDYHLVERFDASFAAQDPHAFIEHTLVGRLGVKFLVVGDDFRFGRGRTGDFNMLQQAGQQFGFAVVDTQSYRQAQTRVSSTAIRAALTAHQFTEAAAMLGRPFMLCGRVVHGEKRGRELGFPTANIMLKRLHSPLRGVYAVRVHGITHHGRAQSHYGVANIGPRPTVNGTRAQIEVHVFDFDDNLYGRQLQIEPIGFVRAEQKFESLTALQAQIKRDVEVAQAAAKR